MTEEKLEEIKSHVQPMDRTCFDVRRAFEDRDALIAEVDRLRGCTFCDQGWVTVNINDVPTHNVKGRSKKAGNLETILLPCTRK